MNALQRTLTIIFILTIFGIVIFMFIIYPTINDIKAFNDRIQIERASLENKYTGRRNIKNIVADLKYVSDGIIPISEKMVISKGREVEFISSLEKIAAKNNVAQKIQITPSAAAVINAKKSEERQNLNITLSGDYIDFLKYLNELEKSEFYIIVNSINITSGDGQNSKAVSAGIIKAYLQGYVYFSI